MAKNKNNKRNQKGKGLKQTLQRSNQEEIIACVAPLPKLSDGLYKNFSCYEQYSDSDSSSSQSDFSDNEDLTTVDNDKDLDQSEENASSSFGESSDENHPNFGSFSSENLSIPTKQVQSGFGRVKLMNDKSYHIVLEDGNTVPWQNQSDIESKYLDGLDIHFRYTETGKMNVTFYKCGVGIVNDSKTSIVSYRDDIVINYNGQLEMATKYVFYVTVSRFGHDEIYILKEFSSKFSKQLLVMEKLEDYRYIVGSTEEPFFSCELYCIKDERECLPNVGDIVDTDVYARKSNFGEKLYAISAVTKESLSRANASQKAYSFVGNIYIRNRSKAGFPPHYEVFLLCNGSSHEFLDFIYLLSARHPPITAIRKHFEWMKYWSQEDLERVANWDFAIYYDKQKFQRFNESQLSSVKEELMDAAKAEIRRRQKEEPEWRGRPALCFPGGRPDYSSNDGRSWLEYNAHREADEEVKMKYSDNSRFMPKVEWKPCHTFETVNDAGSLSKFYVHLISKDIRMGKKSAEHNSYLWVPMKHFMYHSLDEKYRSLLRRGTQSHLQVMFQKIHKSLRL